VQLPGVFIELLAIGEPALIKAGGPREFSFGAFARGFLAHHEGLAMLVVEGKGAQDAAAFRAAGFGDFAVFDFEREGRRPDGVPVKVAFSLAFAADPRAPQAGFFTCQHHYPENFWNPSFQRHANTVAGVAGAVFVAENPADHHVFFKSFAGVSDLQSSSAGITLVTPRGEIQVMEPSAYARHFGVAPPDVAGGMRFAAVRLSVRDHAAARGAVGADARAHMGKLIVGPQAAHGATLVFEDA
jgi:hypothetical protein